MARYRIEVVLVVDEQLATARVEGALILELERRETGPEVTIHGPVGSVDGSEGLGKGSQQEPNHDRGAGPIQERAVVGPPHDVEQERDGHSRRGRGRRSHDEASSEIGDSEVTDLRRI